MHSTLAHYVSSVHIHICFLFALASVNEKKICLGLFVHINYVYVFLFFEPANFSSIHEENDSIGLIFYLHYRFKKDELLLRVRGNSLIFLLLNKNYLTSFIASAY